MAAHLHLLTACLVLGACTDLRDALVPPANAQHSPYADQLDSPIRGLSAQEVDDLRNGRGMGLARAAELNGHPGPRHVLELAAELGVDAVLSARIEAIMAEMSRDARAVGAEILAQEAALSAAFADGSITAAALATRTDALGAAYAKLRGRHLAAHLETRKVLTSEQVARYAALRGYVAAPRDAGVVPADPAGGHHH